MPESSGAITGACAAGGAGYRQRRACGPWPNQREPLDCANTEIPQAECEALLAFYTATGGPNWSSNTGWNNTDTPCSWYGVTCSGGSVTELALPNNALSGSIPPELGSLANLQELYLNNNQLSGPIPPELANLTSISTARLENNFLNTNVTDQTLLDWLNTYGGSWISQNELDCDNTATTPTIGNVYPSTGFAGQENTLIVSGADFAAGAQVLLGDTPLPTVRNSATSLQATVPDSLAAGVYDVIVRNPCNATGQLADAYTLIDSTLNDDLVAEEYDLFTAPPALRAGEPMQLGLVVTRRGGKDTLQNVEVAFSVQQDNGPRQQVGIATIPLLGPRSSAATAVTLEPTLDAGTYTISAVIDPNDAVPEDSSDNNTISRTITVLPSATTDRIAPRVNSFVINTGISTTGMRDILLKTGANDPTEPLPASGITGLYFVEYQYLESVGQWVPVQSSPEFLPYDEARTDYPWTLSTEGA